MKYDLQFTNKFLKLSFLELQILNHKSLNLMS